MRETIDIGGAPYEEDCAQIGEKFDRGPELNQLECRAFITALRRVYGDEPEGAQLKIRANHHDFGTYREVVCVYDTDSQAASAYAQRVEKSIARWRDAGMIAPVYYNDRSEPIQVYQDPASWIIGEPTITVPA